MNYLDYINNAFEKIFDDIEFVEETDKYKNTSCLIFQSKEDMYKYTTIKERNTRDCFYKKMVSSVNELNCVEERFFDLYNHEMTDNLERIKGRTALLFAKNVEDSKSFTYDAMMLKGLGFGAVYCFIPEAINMEPSVKMGDNSRIIDEVFTTYISNQWQDEQYTSIDLR